MLYTDQPTKIKEKTPRFLDLKFQTTNNSCKKEKENYSMAAYTAFFRYGIVFSPFSLRVSYTISLTVL
jgi:hypothetical protein